MTSKELAKKIVKIAGDHKAEKIEVLELKKLASFTDYFVICSGNSDRQVHAIANAICQDLKKDGRIPLGEEGSGGGVWALLDYGDVVTHIFYRDTREHYNLESLWYDAPRVRFRGV